jgi:imidazolonepropionase-like amidohydrolase
VIQVLAAVIVIHAGTLLADPGGKPLHEQTVVVSDGKVSAVENGYQPAERYGADAQLVDLKDRFVLPGLIDLHKHISMPFEEGAMALTSETRLALMTAAIAKAALDAGVTTVRDVGDNVGVTFAVRDAINAGVIEGPRIFAAGRIVSSTGGHGTTKDFQEFEHPRGGCDGAESCRRVVRENIEAGSDWIKMTVSGSGGAASGLADAEPIMLPEEAHAVTDAARRGLRPVAAHAHSTAAIKLALESGARTIEHGTYFDDACARLFKSKGAFLVPTAYVAEFVGKQVEKFSADPRRLPPEALRRWTQAAMANPGRAWRAGVRLGVGSDSGSRNDAHATAREIELFVASGVPVGDAIAAATVTNAEILNMQDRIGRIRPGYEADLIAVAGDPLLDVAKLHSVSFVMKGGAVVQRRAVDSPKPNVPSP